MEEGDVHARRWEDLDNNILVQILQSLDMFELKYGIARVCSAWRMVCCDPFLWETLDLSMLKSNFIITSQVPYVYVDDPSDKRLTRILKMSLSLSRGNLRTLIFNFYLYVNDDQLTYTAERCPQLKRLVLPAWNRVKETGICKAISTWRKLESLTICSITNPQLFIEEISRNCKNLSELKIMDPFEINFASMLANSLPRLKVLSLRCTKLRRDDLIIILDGLQSLEVLNISHCYITTPSGRIVKNLDESILEKASRLREFITCMDDSCIMCQRTKNDKGFMRWHKYEEGLWKEDEVRSLAL